MIDRIVAPEFLFEWEVGVNWGSISDLSRSLYRLPHLQKLYGVSFDIATSMAWQTQGLSFRFEVETKQVRVSYPDIAAGDAIELFIDTRNVKASRTTHRFFHHFFFLPERIEGVQCGEKTNFRTQDAHPLANANDLVVQVERSDKGYIAFIEIPAECLHGYLPEIGERIGFSYRVHTSDKAAAVWSQSGQEKACEAHPHLLPTLILTRNET